MNKVTLFASLRHNKNITLNKYQKLKNGLAKKLIVKVPSCYVSELFGQFHRVSLSEAAGA